MLMPKDKQNVSHKTAPMSAHKKHPEQWRVMRQASDLFTYRAMNACGEPMFMEF